MEQHVVVTPHGGMAEKQILQDFEMYKESNTNRYFLLTKEQKDELSKENQPKILEMESIRGKLQRRGVEDVIEAHYLFAEDPHKEVSGKWGGIRKPQKEINELKGLDFSKINNNEFIFTAHLTGCTIVKQGNKLYHLLPKPVVGQVQMKLDEANIPYFGQGKGINGGYNKVAVVIFQKGEEGLKTWAQKEGKEGVQEIIW